MDAIEDALQVLLGLWLDEKEINVWQMALRAIVVYGVTLLIVRLGKKRFMGRATAFDVILGIMLGSIASRAVTGNTPFFPALAAAATLVAMHWLLTLIAVRWHGFGTVVKGHPRLLVKDGEIDWETMRRTHITEHDLEEDLRGKSMSDVRQVAEARLERSGQVSILKAKREPKVVEIAVADGVQTVRLELG
jgi:uncharacterized membrane protein YcaP (DUF421 family)